MQLEDLLLDDTFHAYVHKTDKREIEKWTKWMEKHPEAKEIIDKASKIIQNYSHYNSWLKIPFSRTEEYKKLINRIKHQQLVDNRINENKYRQWFRIAASIAIVFTLVSAYFIYSGVMALDEPVVYNEITSPKGSKSKVHLEDGTVVWLNAESTLKYPTKFNKDKRKVCLTGEAYFKVKKDADRPFFVSTDNIKIKVLGTSFNVKNYPEDDAIETILESGVIKIHRKTKRGESSGKSITLQPNQKLVLYKDKFKNNLPKPPHKNIKNSREQSLDGLKLTPKKPRLYKNVETENYTAWKDHRLVINEESLGSLVRRLERWYDVNIIVEDELAKQRTLTGVFEKETVEQAVTAICLTTDLKFTIDKDTIKIYQ